MSHSELYRATVGTLIEIFLKEICRKYRTEVNIDRIALYQ